MFNALYFQPFILTKSQLASFWVEFLFLRFFLPGTEVWKLGHLIYLPSGSIKAKGNVWWGDQPLCSRFGRLFRLDVDLDCLVSDRRNQDVWCWHWRRMVRGGQEQHQLREVAHLLQSMSCKEAEDSFSWSLDTMGNFSVHVSRNHIDNVRLPNGGVPSRWCKALPKKVKIFQWRLVLDRLPTRFNLSKHGMQLDLITCPCCGHGGETVNHLFFHCPLAKEVWSLVNRWCGVVFPVSVCIKEWLSWMDERRCTEDCKIRLEVVIMAMCWNIWRYRNALVFDNGIVRKGSIFDSIVLNSFFWFKYRGSNSGVVWNTWMYCPLFFFSL